MKAVVIVAVIFLIHIIFPRFFFSLFNIISRPIWKTENVVISESYGTAGYFMSKRLLLEENDRLKNDNESLKNENLKLNIIENENNELKKILNRTINKDKTVIASVLQKPPSIPYDNLIIDIGENEGIIKGDKVVIDGNNILGEIEEVLEKTSKVRLYSTNGQKTDVEVGTSTIQAVAIGRGGGNFEVIVPRATKISIGEFVFLPGINQQIFGIIEDTVIDPAHGFVKVFFRSPYNISSIKWVEVIKQ
ncbi:MAG: rod shape-determining protein MreC [Patescibacteria group bacterium]